MGILGVVFDPVNIFVPLPTPNYRADVRLVLIVATSVASEMESDLYNLVTMWLTVLKGYSL